MISAKPVSGPEDRRSSIFPEGGLGNFFRMADHRGLSHCGTTRKSECGTTTEPAQEDDGTWKDGLFGRTRPDRGKCFS